MNNSTNTQTHGTFLNVFYWWYIFLWDQHTISSKETLFLNTYVICPSYEKSQQALWRKEVVGCLSPLSLSSLASDCCLSQFMDGHNIEYNTHGVKCYTHRHTHAQTSGDQLQCLQLVPSSSAAIWSWRISWDVKSKRKLLITPESKFELISQFHFPFEVVREEPKQSPYEPCNNQNHSHFLGQKYGFKELFCSTSEVYPSFTML